jgi:LemA protein
MNEMAAIVLGIFVLIGILVAVQYNGLAKLRNHCTEAWADIDTELKRRHDLIPNLVSTVQGYAGHERDLFERVARARQSVLAADSSPRALAAGENTLTREVRQLVALAESYPELKASSHFLQLQTELAHTEDRIQRARRFYNANVRDLNTRIDVFPSNFVAGWFDFERRDPFELDEARERERPAVAFD